MNRYTQYSQSEYAKPWELPFNELNAALASKQKKQDEDVALNDKLSELMPKAGYVTEPILTEYKGKYNPLIDQIREQVSKGEGNQSAIKNLASQMVQDPRYDYLAQDYKLKPKIDEYIAKNTYDKDVQGFYKNGVFTPSTGTNIPLGEVYKTTGFADWQEGYRKDVRENIVDQIKKEKPDIYSDYLRDASGNIQLDAKGQPIEQVYTKGGKTKYFTEDLVNEKLDAVDPNDPNGATLLDKMYDSRGKDYENYRQAFYEKNAGQTYTKEDYRKDLVASTRGLFASVTDETLSSKNIGGFSANGGGKKGKIAPGDPNFPTTTFDDYGVLHPDLKVKLQDNFSLKNLNDVVVADSKNYDETVKKYNVAFTTDLKKTLGIPTDQELPDELKGIITYKSGTTNPLTGEVDKLPGYTFDPSKLSPEQKQKIAATPGFLQHLQEVNVATQTAFNHIKAHEVVKNQLEADMKANGLDDKVLQEAEQVRNNYYEVLRKNGVFTQWKDGKKIEVIPESYKKEGDKKVNDFLIKKNPAYKEFVDRVADLTKITDVQNPLITLEAYADDVNKYGLAKQLTNLATKTIGLGNEFKRINVNDAANPNRALETEEYNNVMSYIDNMNKDEKGMISKSGLFQDAQDKQWKVLLTVPSKFEVDKNGKIKITGNDAPLQVQVTLDQASILPTLNELGVTNPIYQQKTTELTNGFEKSDGFFSSFSDGNGKEFMKVKKLAFDSPEGNKGQLKATYGGVAKLFNNEVDLIQFGNDIQNVDETLSTITDPAAFDKYSAMIMDGNVSNATTIPEKLNEVKEYILQKNGYSPEQIKMVLPTTTQVKQIPSTTTTTPATTGTPPQGTQPISQVITGSYKVDPSVSSPYIAPAIVQNVNDIVTSFPNITITSAYRTPGVNQADPDSVPNSKHLIGKALDIRIDKYSADLYDTLGGASKEVLSQYGIEDIIKEKDHYHIEFK